MKKNPTRHTVLCHPWFGHCDIQPRIDIIKACIRETKPKRKKK